jgi:hypothetical protein
MTDMKQPQDRDADRAQYEVRSPTWAIVTWMNAELRDRIRRNGVSLAEIHLAKDAQISGPTPDPRLEDREAEP